MNLGFVDELDAPEKGTNRLNWEILKIMNWKFIDIGNAKQDDAINLGQ